MAVWTWDTTHFTLDSSTHKFDGWHDDTPVEQNQKAIWGPGLQKHLQAMRLRNQIKDEDEIIMGVITEFLRRAA